jgi:hypothetical protein
MIGGSVVLAQGRPPHSGTIIGEPQNGIADERTGGGRRPMSARTPTLNASVSRADDGVKGKLASLVVGGDP